MSSVTTTRRLAPEEEGCKSPVPGALSITRFKSDERGNVALTFGLTIFMMVGFIGASVDIGRLLLARKQTQEAMDAAVLAGVRKYQDTSDINAAKSTANAVYQASIAQNGRGTHATNPHIDPTEQVVFQPSNNNTKLTGTAQTTLKTPFIGIATKAFGGGNTSIGTLPIDVSSVAEVAFGGNAGTNLEISIMVDITGSMNEGDNAGSTKIETVKKALQGTATQKGIIDILIWDDQSTYTSKIALVPFSEAVNLGSPSIAQKARGNYQAGAASGQGGGQYLTVNGTNLPISNICVTERIGNHEYDDTSPNSDPVGRYYSTYGVSQGTGVCPTATPVVPLSSDKAALKAVVNSLDAGGYTAGHIGTAWAWYMLSPNFNSIWTANAGVARPYSDLTALTSKGRPVLRKIAVLMTDGDYNTEYRNGVTTRYNNSNPTNDTSQNQALALCNGMKAKGIEVYTIGAQVSSNAKAFLKSCATDPTHYYDATDGTKMQQAFMDIAYKLVPPYISH